MRPQVRRLTATSYRWLFLLFVAVASTLTLLAACSASTVVPSPPIPTPTAKATPTVSPLITPARDTASKAPPDTPTPLPDTPQPAHTPPPGTTPSATPPPALVTATLEPPDTGIPAAPVVAVINGNRFQLELAVSAGQRRQGLSGRKSLPLHAGMLFVYSREQPLTFWMKDVPFSLDILVINSQRRIVDIQTMVPQPGVGDDDLTLYRSAAPSMFALEINGGQAARLDITVGMEVSLLGS